jgi:hypothetical protein
VLVDDLEYLRSPIEVSASQVFFSFTQPKPNKITAADFAEAGKNKVEYRLCN